MEARPFHGLVDAVPRAVHRDAHQIEITVDDERVQLTSVGGAGRGGQSAGRGAGRGAAAGAGRGGADPLEFRIAVKAGPRLVGVTFIEHNQARDQPESHQRHDEECRPKGRLPHSCIVTQWFGSLSTI